MGGGVGWVWVWDSTLSVQDLVRDCCRGVAVDRDSGMVFGLVAGLRGGFVFCR